VAGKNRVRTIAKWAILPVGVVLSGIMVLGFSNSAFTATTTNANNSWSTGTVNINNNLAAPMFSYSANTYKGAKDALLIPNQAITSQITITYTGNVKSDIRIYPSGNLPTGALADNMTLDIKDGANSVFNGSLTSFGTKANWATTTAVPWIATTNGETKTYTFTVTAGANVPSGATLDATTFTWEAHATP